MIISVLTDSQRAILKPIMGAILEDERWRAGLKDWECDTLVWWSEQYLVQALANGESIDAAQIVVERVLNAAGK